MKHKIIIEEIVSQEFEIEVPEGEDEIEIGIEKYRSGELVLDNASVTCRNISTEESSWTQF